ncbi:hypothetical protein [Falsiroseomonas sp. HW251]|uniref:hypothetical protein n=1 Tax=Falsiroseomonas sp. HW251 TaxID=3390998 RepID=UPI003D31DEE1
MTVSPRAPRATKASTMPSGVPMAKPPDIALAPSGITAAASAAVMASGSIALS